MEFRMASMEVAAQLPRRRLVVGFHRCDDYVILGCGFLVRSFWNPYRRCSLRWSQRSSFGVPRQTIKRLRPPIFLFRRFLSRAEVCCGWHSILLNRSSNLDLHALAWAIGSVTHLALALFVSRSFAPFSWTQCFRTTSHAQLRFTTGSKKVVSSGRCSFSSKSFGSRLAYRPVASNPDSMRDRR